MNTTSKIALALAGGLVGGFLAASFVPSECGKSASSQQATGQQTQPASITLDECARKRAAVEGDSGKLLKWAASDEGEACYNAFHAAKKPREVASGSASVEAEEFFGTVEIPDATEDLGKHIKSGSK